MVKKLSALLILSTLTGCALLPDKFDNVEYSQLVNLYLVASERSCLEQDIIAMKYYSKFLVKYSDGTLNKNVTSIYRDIASNVEQLATKDNPSTAYCLAKKDIIAEQADQHYLAIS